MITLGKLVETVEVPARHGAAARVKKGQKVKVIDVQGKQVCDFFAIDPNNPAVFFSGTYTRSNISFMRPQIGKPLYDNQRQPMLMWEEDHSPGIHDMLYAP